MPCLLGQCESQDQVCARGPLADDAKVPTEQIVLGPMYAIESTATPPGQKPVVPGKGMVTYQSSA